MSASFCTPSRKREGAGGWAPGQSERDGCGEREPTPNPSRKREGGQA